MAKITEDNFTYSDAKRIEREIEVCRLIARSFERCWHSAKINKETFIAPKKIHRDFRRLEKFLGETKRIRKSCISPLRQEVYDSANVFTMIT